MDSYSINRSRQILTTTENRLVTTDGRVLFSGAPRVDLWVLPFVGQWIYTYPKWFDLLQVNTKMFHNGPFVSSLQRGS